jgi:seryl-tRNA synthetase
MQLGPESPSYHAKTERLVSRSAADELFSTANGMATFTDRGQEIYQKLESIFLHWASATRASSVRYPALLRVSDLDRLNYFRNFPHLVLCACGLDLSAHVGHGQRQGDIAALTPAELSGAEYCLPPAACYNVYLSLRGQHLTVPRHVTTVGTCFRNEEHYDGLRRLRAFTLREIVCVGDAAAVKRHLQTYRAIIVAFLKHLGLPVSIEKASDPFFDKDGTAARAARIFPTKEEIVFRDELAIGSLNYHRRFFGERCEISFDRDTAHTGCVGFGIERWIQALSEHFGPDVERISSALDAAEAKLVSSTAGLV